MFCERRVMGLVVASAILKAFWGEGKISNSLVQNK
jgi:hypothetical protein